MKCEECTGNNFLMKKGYGWYCIKCGLVSKKSILVNMETYAEKNIVSSDTGYTDSRYEKDRKLEQILGSATALGSNVFSSDVSRINRGWRSNTLRR